MSTHLDVEGAKNPSPRTEVRAATVDTSRSALDAPVYIGPNHKLPAIHAPDTQTDSCRKRKCAGPHTTDWRAEPGSPGNFHGVTATLVRSTVRAVFERQYPTEAHFVAYELSRGGAPLEAQPRVAKDALPWLRAQGFEVRLTCLLADLDTPGHVPWTPELRADFDALWASAAGPLATCAVFLSPKGARIVQPLQSPPLVEEGEAHLRAWLADLVAVGAHPSVGDVKDWTRMMRVANYMRWVK